MPPTLRINKIPEDKTGSPRRRNPRAEAIRYKLIYTFYMMSHLQELIHAVPRHNIQDFLDPRKRKKLMLTDHHQLVRFNIMPIRNMTVTPEKRWRNQIEVRCSRWPPLKMWAFFLLNSHIFKGFMIFLIILYMMVLMIVTEVKGRSGPDMDRFKIALQVMLSISLMIFIFEIGLHLVVDFWMYWKNPWNVLDFTVTFTSFVPLLAYSAGLLHSSTAYRLVLICRTLRCLKLFPRVTQVRVLIMAIAKALKAMTFILVLLAFLFYVFAVSGIFFFESHSISQQDDLEYQRYFRDVPNALVTIFILFTMDHWYALLQDSWKVPEMSRVLSGTFIFLWLLIGAFIFRNLFVAIMVTNFQNIRSDLSEEAKEIETQKQADKFKMDLLERRYSQDQPSTMKEKLNLDFHPDFPNRSEEFFPEVLDWETYIHKNLPGLYVADEGEQVLWPRDSLFRYFELMEKLQYNLDVRKELQQYAIAALSNMEDKKPKTK